MTAYDCDDLPLPRNPSFRAVLKMHSLREADSQEWTSKKHCAPLGFKYFGAEGAAVVLPNVGPGVGLSGPLSNDGSEVCIRSLLRW